MTLRTPSLAAAVLMLTSAAALAQDPNPPHPSEPSEWSVVTELHAGTEVMMQVRLARYTRRYLVAATDTDVTVLNLNDPWLPPPARETLRHLAFYEPQYLLGLGGQDFVHRNVRVTSEAVFLDGKKLIDLSDTIQRFARADVNEIKRAPRTSTGQALGMFAGGLSGGIAGAMFGHREFKHYKPAGAILVGFSGTFFGVGLGQLVGSLFDPQPKVLIFKAGATGR